MKNSKDSPGKRLGLKESGGSFVEPGNILVRQRGFEVHAGRGVKTGKDHTLYAAHSGQVQFTYLKRPFRRSGKERKFINVVNTQAGETVEQLHEEMAQLQADYVEVLRRKRAGLQIPTTRSVYLAQAGREKRERLRLETQQMIERVNARKALPTAEAREQAAV